MDQLTFELILIFICLCFSAFFSCSETALTAISRARMFALMQEGVKRAALVIKLRDKKDALIGTILLGNNIVNIGAASLGTVICIKFFGEEFGPLYATVIMTIVVLIFGEVAPKTIAIHHSERAAMLLSPMLMFIFKLLYPVTVTVQWLVRNLLRLVGLDVTKAKSMSTAHDAIRGAIELHHSEGEVEKDDRDMLGSILDLDHRTLGQIMIHRSEVDMIDFGLEPEEIINASIAINHSRIPLWKDDPDNIIGILHMKDLLRLIREQRIGITREMIRRIAHKPWFVPETTNLANQLGAFRSKRKHFACVVDEYGAWKGIVTLEDILEEIVGEIDDEHDPLEMAEVIPYGENAYRVAGRLPVRDLNRQMDWDLPEDHAATLAGLVLHYARVIPDKHAVFEFSGTRFTVAEKKGNQLTELIIERLPVEEEFADDQE
ncbi:MAG: HlyC/CorC family transporter [Rickettsiales bacterium]